MRHWEALLYLTEMSKVKKKLTNALAISGVKTFKFQKKKNDNAVVIDMLFSLVYFHQTRPV